MRDRMEAELWNAHHDQFSQWLDGRVSRAGSALRRGGSAVRVPAQFAAAVAAVSLAGLTLGTVFV
ncbi:MAG TPA: hypothetical protein VGB79_04405 [Allosphingosinicella sp.]|jgi:hypothetical protein